MVQIQGVSKRFGDQQVLQNLSFELLPQQVYGLLGPNGSGKTTTINLIGQRLRPDQGQIQMEGRPIAHQPRSWLGVATQETILYGSLTCRENLHFFAQIYGVPPAQIQARVGSCLGAVDLIPCADRIVAHLSGGLQRRLHIAIALIHHPQVLILDEPTTGLDVESRYQIWELIQTWKQRARILLTTHLFDEAERICDRIGILHQGRLVAEGSLMELRQQISGQHQITLQTPEVDRVLHRAAQLGYQTQHHHQTVILQISKPLDLRQILEHFPDIHFDALSRVPLSLEQIYLQLTQQPSIGPERSTLTVGSRSRSKNI